MRKPRYTTQLTLVEHITSGNRDHQVNLTYISERAPFTPLDSDPPHLHTALTNQRALPAMVKQYGNVYLIAAISIIGGGLFGFDISSMSAM